VLLYKRYVVTIMQMECLGDLTKTLEIIYKQNKLSLLITFTNNNNKNNVKMFSVKVFLTRWSLRPKRWGQNWQRKSLLPV